NSTLDYCDWYFEELLQHIFLQRINAKSSQQITVQDFTYFKDIASQWLTIKLSGRSKDSEPILPDHVYDTLGGLKRFDSMKGRQDAEKFPSFLFHGLHEEFLVGGELQGTRNKQSINGMEVEQKNKKVILELSIEIEESPISRIFGDQLRSVLQCPGGIDSITLDPFLSLQLDIQVRATKRLYIETLPPILTLHLKRFAYGNVGGTQKLSKHIRYSITLSIKQGV
ncbi:21000_t:CDS:2, partial [Cetraspora pellucida]